MEEYLYNQALQSIRYGGVSANEIREYMALIDKYTEVETLYANNAPIEYVVKSPSVDIWRHEAPVITPKRQNLVKDVLFKVVGLRIHALRTKHEPSDMKQLLIYDALFCLKHGIKPCDIQIENRIYQNNDVLIANPTFEDIDPIIEKIKEFDRVVREVKSGKMA